MASAEDLRRQCEEQALALDEHEDRADWLLQVQSEMREVNLRNKELETRNASLEWDATRCAPPILLPSWESMHGKPGQLQRCAGCVGLVSGMGGVTRRRQSKPSHSQVSA